MSTPSVPKALYQANIDLALRIAALLQEHGQQWFDLFADEAGMRLGQGLAGVDRFRRDFSLDALTALPADLAGHFGALDAERWQSLLAKAIDHQSRFSAGVQAALENWQEACSQLLGEALPPRAFPDMSQVMAVVPGLGEILSPRQRPMARGGRASAQDAAASEPVPEPAKPRRKTPAAAAGKTAASKTAKTPAASVPAKPAEKASLKAAKAGAGRAKPSAKVAKKTGAAPPADGRKADAARFPSPMPALVTTPRQRRKS